MFGWNPFKPRDAGAEPDPQPSQPRGNAALLAALQQLDPSTEVPASTYELLRDARLLVALKSKPTSPEDDFDFWILSNGSQRAFAAFTDASTAQAFFAQGSAACIALSGQQLCRLAAGLAGEEPLVDRIVINPGAASVYEVPPLIFQAIAQDVVPGQVAVREATNEVLSVVPFSTPLSPAYLDELREVLLRSGAQQAACFVAAPAFGPPNLGLAVEPSTPEFLQRLGDILATQLPPMPEDLSPFTTITSLHGAQSREIAQHGVRLI